MQLRNTGELMHPGCCAVCGNGTCEFGYVDLGVYYDYEGQVYLCMTCIDKDLTEVAGLLSKGEVELLQHEANELAKSNKQLTEQLEKANERLNHYDSLFVDRFSSHPFIASDSTEQQDDESISEFQQRDNEPVSGLVSEREESDAELSESTSEQDDRDSGGIKSSNFEL